MSAIILFQQGDKCLNPQTNTYYEPWESHIYDCLSQCRKWNKKVPLYVILDSEYKPNAEFIEDLNVTIVDTSSLVLSRNLDSLSDYYKNDRNPLWRSSLIRFFYIEQLMKDEKLDNVFTFDNDVLVYSDLEDLCDIFVKNYQNCAITRISDDGIVCGMTWFKNIESISRLNDKLIEFNRLDEFSKLSETTLLHNIHIRSENDLIELLPIWYSGSNSNGIDDFKGFFDPGTFGQFLGGCHSGSPPGHIMLHHLLGKEIKNFVETREFEMVKNIDKFGRYYFSMKSNFDSREYKIHSIHVHSKKLKQFM